MCRAQRCGWGWGWDALRGRVWDGCICCIGKQLTMNATLVDVVVVNSDDHFGPGEADEGAEPVRIPAAIAVEPAAWSHVRAKGLVPCRFPHGRRVEVVMQAVM